MGIAAGPLSLIAGGLSLVGSAVGAGAKVFAGEAQAEGDTYEAQQSANAAEIGLTAAAQTSTYMNQDLTRQIQTIQAIRASANVESDSPTGEAIANNVYARGQQQIGVKVGNILDQVSADQAAASFYASSAQNAIIGGYLGAAGSVATGLAGGFTSLNTSLGGSNPAAPPGGYFPIGV